MEIKFESLQRDLTALSPLRRTGQITEVSADRLRISGLRGCSPGDRVALLAGRAEAGQELFGEITAVEGPDATALPESQLAGLMPGDRAWLMGPAMIAPDASWCGRVIDPTGQPLDGRPLRQGSRIQRLQAPPPAPASRRGFGARLSTGVAVFDTLLPLVRGQRMGLFAGSGVGKSSLLAQFACGVEADVTVIALVGERGRELRHFTQTVLGREGLARTVVVAATSDQSALLRRRCLLTAMATAEFFRDRGAHVLLLVDSVTRFAEAHREIALASGELASLRGYPPSTAHALMSLCERAGPGAGISGDITAVFSVLVAGSDMEEPIADILRGTIDGHVILNRSIAERGRYPATDALRSVSRSLPAAASAEENALIAEARKLLSAFDRAEMMIQAGLYLAGSDPLVDRALQLWPALDGFCSEAAPMGGNQASFDRLRQLLSAQRPGVA